MLKLRQHPDDPTRIVLADYIETTFARTECGMFSDEQNAEHARLIVEAVNGLSNVTDA